MNKLEKIQNTEYKAFELNVFRCLAYYNVYELSNYLMIRYDNGVTKIEIQAYFFDSLVLMKVCMDKEDIQNFFLEAENQIKYFIKENYWTFYNG